MSLNTNPGSNAPEALNPQPTTINELNALNNQMKNGDPYSLEGGQQSRDAQNSLPSTAATDGYLSGEAIPSSSKQENDRANAELNNPEFDAALAAANKNAENIPSTPDVFRAEPFKEGDQAYRLIIKNGPNGIPVKISKKQDGGMLAVADDGQFYRVEELGNQHYKLYDKEGVMQSLDI